MIEDDDKKNRDTTLSSSKNEDRETCSIQNTSEGDKVNDKDHDIAPSTSKIEDEKSSHIQSTNDDMIKERDITVSSLKNKDKKISIIQDTNESEKMNSKEHNSIPSSSKNEDEKLSKIPDKNDDMIKDNDVTPASKNEDDKMINIPDTTQEIKTTNKERDVTSSPSKNEDEKISKIQDDDMTKESHVTPSSSKNEEEIKDIIQDTNESDQMDGKAHDSTPSPSKNEDEKTSNINDTNDDITKNCDFAPSSSRNEDKDKDIVQDMDESEKTNNKECDSTPSPSKNDDEKMSSIQDTSDDIIKECDVTPVSLKTEDDKTIKIQDGREENETKDKNQGNSPSSSKNEDEKNNVAQDASQNEKTNDAEHDLAPSSSKNKNGKQRNGQDTDENNVLKEDGTTPPPKIENKNICNTEDTNESVISVTENDSTHCSSENKDDEMTIIRDENKDDERIEKVHESTPCLPKDEDEKISADASCVVNSLPQTVESSSNEKSECVREDEKMDVEIVKDSPLILNEETSNETNRNNTQEEGNVGDIPLKEKDKDKSMLDVNDEKDSDASKLKEVLNKNETMKANDEAKTEQHTGRTSKRSRVLMENIVESPLPRKRVRKSVDRHVPPTSPNPSEFKVDAGRGTKISNIESSRASILSMKNDTELIRMAHKLIFGGARRGKGSQKQNMMMIRQILEFSGFLSPQNEKDRKIDKEREAKLSVKVCKLFIPQLKELCDFFDIDRSPNGERPKMDKDGLIDRLLEFMGAPAEEQTKGFVKGVYGVVKVERKTPTKKRKVDLEGSASPKATKIRFSRKRRAQRVRESSGDETETRENSDSEDVFDYNEETDTMPSVKKLRTWVRAYITCFNLDKATTKHAVETASDKFGVDMGKMKGAIKKILAEELS